MWLFNNTFNKPDLLTDIKWASESLIPIFKQNYEVDLDYSIEALTEIEDFLELSFKNGKAITWSPMEEWLWSKLFCIWSYIWETIIKNSPWAKWVPNSEKPDDDFLIEIHLKDWVIIWPMQKLMKRVKNWNEDNIHFYVTSILSKSTL